MLTYAEEQFLSVGEHENLISTKYSYHISYRKAFLKASGNLAKTICSFIIKAAQYWWIRLSIQLIKYHYANLIGSVIYVFFSPTFQAVFIKNLKEKSWFYLAHDLPLLLLLIQFLS